MPLIKTIVDAEFRTDLHFRQTFTVKCVVDFLYIEYCRSVGVH